MLLGIERAVVEDVRAVRCVDPFHVIQLATDALDEIRREVWNQARRAGLESFQLAWRCGCSPNAFHILSTADCVSPTSAAIERVDQCVAFLGVVSSVLTITFST
jgi:hypothetical protein